MKAPLYMPYISRVCRSVPLWCGGSLSSPTEPGRPAAFSSSLLGLLECVAWLRCLRGLRVLKFCVRANMRICGGVDARLRARSDAWRAEYSWSCGHGQRSPVNESRIASPASSLQLTATLGETKVSLWSGTSPLMMGKNNSGVRPVNEAVGPTFPLIGQDDVGKEVSCWNARCGCDFIGPAGELLEHFEKHCSFHAIACSRCTDTVLRNDLPRHYQGGCNEVASLPPADAGHVSATNEGAPPAGESRGRDLVVECSCHDMLTSIQGHVNGLAESLDKIGSKRLSEKRIRVNPSTSHSTSGGLDSTVLGQDLTSLSVASSLGALVSALNEMKLVVTEGFRRMERTARGKDARSASASSMQQLQVAVANRPVQDQGHPPSGLPDVPGNSGGRRVVANGEATEEWFVFSVQYEPWLGETKYYSERKAAYHSISVNHEKTGVDIKCVVHEGSSFVAVYAVSTSPASWKLSAVRPLRSEDMCSPYLRDWIFMRRNEGCSLAELSLDWRLRCVLETTCLPSETVAEEGIHADFLVKLQRSSTVTPNSEKSSHS